METGELPSVVEVAVFIETCRCRNGRIGTEWSELDHIPDYMHPIDTRRTPRAGLVAIFNRRIPRILLVICRRQGPATPSALSPLGFSASLALPSAAVSWLGANSALALRGNGVGTCV